jgi:hypothetical protein
MKRQTAGTEGTGYNRYMEFDLLLGVKIVQLIEQICLKSVI